MDSSVRPQGSEHIPADADIVVIGAGFAGLYAHYCFRQEGYAVFGFEAADDVGGTWYWNRYPGARCDVESVEYCYSFSPELLDEWEWSERFATQPEILKYAQHVADRFDLKRDIAFSRRVTSPRYDEPSNRWIVETDRGDRISCQYLVTAVGCLSAPKAPDFTGLSSFRGEWVQTGAWPAAGVDLAGKRVAVIGTGSSAIQSIPVIAETAAHVTVFQRTANYSVPAYNGPITAERRAEVRKDYPGYMAGLRGTKGGQVFHEITGKSALEFAPDERERLYERAWELGRWTIQSVFNDTTLNPEANRLAAEFVERKIRADVKDPAVADLLVPKGFPFGTKRLCLDTGYYQTFNRENVELVDLHKAPIERITPDGVATSEREYPADLIVFAIGFDAMTGPLLNMGIVGRDGRSLNAEWRDGPTSYLGLSIAGFPNLFTINGPSSPSVLVNMILTVEHHVDLIAEMLRAMHEQGLDRMEANPAAAAAWAAETQAIAARTLFPKANSWYMGANVDGKPRLFMAYIGGFDRYIARCEQVAADGYAGFRLDRANAAPAREAATA